MNLALAIKGSDQIKHFILDCVQEGRNLIGSNKKMLGVTFANYDFKWTEDIANPIYDAGGEIAGYDKAMSDLTEADGSELESSKSDHKAYQDAVRIQAKVSKLTLEQIDNRIDTLFSNLSIEQRGFLKKLTKAVWAQARIIRNLSK